MYTVPLYCTSTLYTFSHAVSTNQSQYTFNHAVSTNQSRYTFNHAVSTNQRAGIAVPCHMSLRSSGWGESGSCTQGLGGRINNNIPISIYISTFGWFCIYLYQLLGGFVFICIYYLLVFYDQSDDIVEYIWVHWRNLRLSK